MKSELTYSIVIPVYNNPEDLRSCLESISQLDFDRKAFEVIVVDNNSNDNTADIARSFEDVICLSETMLQGSYAARNTGIKAAKGKFIAFTDSDCRVDSQWLTEIDKVAHDPKIGCIAGEILATTPETLVERFSDSIGLLRQRGPLSGWHFKPYAQTANATYRRELLNTIGGFDGSMESGGDAEIAWRMLDNTDYTLEFAPDAVVYHHHRTSLIELWKQFRRYGRGKLSWATAQEAFVPPDPSKLEDEVVELFEATLTALEDENVSEVDVIYPFLRSVSQSAHLFGYQADILRYMSHNEASPNLYRHALKASPKCSLCGGMSFLKKSGICHGCGSQAVDRVLVDALADEQSRDRALMVAGRLSNLEDHPSANLEMVSLNDLAKHESRTFVMFHDFDVEGSEEAKTHLLHQLTRPLAQDGALIICNKISEGENLASQAARLDSEVSHYLPYVSVRSSVVVDNATREHFALVVAAADPALASRLCLQGST